MQQRLIRIHLVKSEDYYYDNDAIRLAAMLARLDQPQIATATGLTLNACLERIAANSLLSEDEKDTQRSQGYVR